MKLPKGTEDMDFHEYYGPIDGIVPLEGHGYYQHLHELICSKGIVLASASRIHYTFCNDCWSNVDSEWKANATALHNRLTVHEAHTIRGTESRNEKRCHRCQRLAYKVQPAKDCRDCIEQYMMSRASLIAGEVVEVERRY